MISVTFLEELHCVPPSYLWSQCVIEAVYDRVEQRNVQFVGEIEQLHGLLCDGRLRHNCCSHFS